VKNDKFEELIKQSLEQIEPEVPAHLWDNIASRISVSPPAQQAPAADGGVSAGAGMSGSAGLLKVAAAALLITGGAYVAYQMFTDKPEAVEVVAADKVENQAKNFKADKSTGAANQVAPLNIESEDNIVFEGEQVDGGESETYEGSATTISKDSDNSATSFSNLEEVTNGALIKTNETAGVIENQSKVVAKTGKNQSSSTLQSQNDQDVVIVEAGILAGNVSGDVPLTINFQNMSAAKSYEWDFGDGTKSYEPSPSHTFEYDSDFTVKLTITDFNGNVLKDQIEISAYLPSTLFVPNAFSPNGDGKNDYFTVEGTNVKDINFKVLRLDGSVVFEGKSLNDKWDGTDSQDPLAKNYIYQAKAIGSNGKAIQKNGFLNAFRDAQ
jgi:gliding motility-associated-like protein